MKTKIEDFSTFSSAFMGEEILITTDLIETSAQTSTDLEKNPLYFQGILLDIDEDFYFLGDTPAEINQAVKKKNVVHIGIVEKVDEYEEILRDMPTPNNKEEIN